MKRTSSRKYRLGYFAQFIEKGEVVSFIKCQKKSKVLDWLSTLSMGQGHVYLRVTYAKDHWNDCDAFSVEEAINNLNTYTEKQLLDFVEVK